MKSYLWTLLAMIALTVSCASAQSKPSNEQTRFKLAADYSKDFRGLSVLVMKGDRVVFEEYQNGFTAAEAHLLASGTKSFSGVLLAAAIEDKLVKDFDEKVSETLTEWRSDPQKSRITLRQLLSLTSGIDAGAIGRPPAYAEAINFSVKFGAGERFEYGPVPFQIFGEVMRRKLAPKKETVMDYLQRRIFEPIGLKYADWTMRDGQPNLPSGAYLSAREWLKFGQFLKNGGKWNGKQLVAKKLLDELVTGSKINPNYGLTFWLNRAHDGSARLAEKTPSRLQQLLDIQPETDQISLRGIDKNLPHDIFMAAGAGKQRLYVIPSLDLVVVRQGRQSRFDDREFLQRLILGKTN